MIEIRNLEKKYGKRTILEDVSFTIKKNEVTCLTGMNGTGKTTLMNCIMGLVPRKTARLRSTGKTFINSYTKKSPISLTN